MQRSKRSKKKDFRQVAFTRFMLIVAVFILWIGGIGVRLFHLQVTQHAWLKEKALDLRMDVKQGRMLRGSIYDRNGRALAMSVQVKTLYADPREIGDADAAAKPIAAALKIDPNQLAAQLHQAKDANKRFIPIAKKLDIDAVQALNRALDTPGIKKADAPNFEGLHWIDDQKRKYPYESLAAQVVGFSNADDDGRAGIEQSQDEALHGAIIRKVQERDRLGRVYDETIVERDKPSDVVLTINATYQYMVEQALERGVRAAEAKSGMAVLINPKNGEILALANYPTFDPNAFNEAAAENMNNKAIQSVYSPGSVFKIVTYGSGLEKHLFTPDDMIDAGNGTIEVAGHVFTEGHGGGRMTYSDALAHSNNICAIKTGLSVGRDDFYKMVRGMGFGSPTGVELPAETRGIVRAPEKWNGDSLASMSIGYEIGVTALQMTTAFATIADDGVRIQPHLIKEIRRSEEEPILITKPEQRQVITADTARNLKKMLRQVVLGGTGRRAQLDGYTCAGKTGTAWKVNTKSKSVDSSKYVSSFIGMAPLDHPEIVLAVVMDEPKVAARDGGMVSAPVFREIAQAILEDMKVPHDSMAKQENLVAKEIRESPQTDSVKEKPQTEAVKTKPQTDVPEKNAKPKIPVPAIKPKNTDKTRERKLPDIPKITALMPRRLIRSWKSDREKIELET
jgi:cell division protein FtsI (penicillin-binding protein 3)